MPATPAEREPAAVPSGLGKAFFQSLDGAPQWADAPTRPEAGGRSGWGCWGCWIVLGVEETKSRPRDSGLESSSFQVDGLR